ncbi:helix-turn-helix domain-containing protein [Extibacter muris]|uniref:XRE family transcriptional regulator n=1 Tax=Extibacter muris TaxID=1796622 RepID=A0A4R4FKU2_9FIRM|nr:helix-turn-helix transcriptional regulator [Extibacter muris]MCU0079189.1 helix-turn-helix domain-containing protein [Extibacter muris]TDA23276.1 XRE family transcriptional regulator [Extibacter muris]
MNYRLLGHNIQLIRKLKGLTQQELSDQIGINLQSLSKIERGINYPTFETLEKLTEALGVTPNELLAGELKSTSHIESDILGFLDCEERLNVELAHGQYDNPLDEEKWLEYELKKLQEYISDYVHSEKRSAADLYPLKKLIQYQKFQKLLDRYDDYLCFDIFGETIEGHKHVNPYAKEIIKTMATDEEGKISSELDYPDDFD